MKEIKESLKEIKINLAACREKISIIQGETILNRKILEEHMVRTELSEKRIATVEAWLLGTLTTGVLALLAKLFF